jgi:hypothetical protein
MREAPVYIQTADLALWILNHAVGDPQRPLWQRIQRQVLDLLEEIVLALKDFERPRRVKAADATLLLLRTHLHLAYRANLVSEAQWLFLAQELDAIGRQIGGWRNRIERATGASALQTPR